MSCQNRTSSASSRPSSSKPTLTCCSWPRSCALEMKCSRRSSTHFTGRPDRPRPAASRPTAPAPPPATGARSSPRSRRPTSGAMQSTLVSGSAELGGDRGAHATSRSGSRCAPAASRSSASQRARRPCPPSAWRRCARCPGRARARAARRPSRLEQPSSRRCCSMWAATLSGTSSCTSGARRARAASMPTTGQELVLDDDRLAGVLGDVAVGRDHHDDGLADVVDLVLGQRVAGAAGVQRRVRDEQRQRLADPGALARRRRPGPRRCRSRPRPRRRARRSRRCPGSGRARAGCARTRRPARRGRGRRGSGRRR